MRTAFVLALILLVNLNCFSQVAEPKPHYVGEKYGGGIIFFVDPSGLHGLIAAPFDQSNSTCWGNAGDSKAYFLDDGSQNTQRIVTFLKTKKTLNCPAPAACLCDTLTIGNLTDWYLPSLIELGKISENTLLIGGFVNSLYCSSTEDGKSKCWSILFDPVKKKKFAFQKSQKTYSVRCIRKF